MLKTNRYFCSNYQPRGAKDLKSLNLSRVVFMVFVVLLASSAFKASALDMNKTRKHGRYYISSLETLYRLNDPLSHFKISQNGRFMAFVEHPPHQYPHLKVLDVMDRALYQVSKLPFDHHFFFSPLGYRLFYVQQYKQDDVLKSAIMSYDNILNKNITVKNLDKKTGFLSFNQSDLSIRYLSGDSLKMLKLKMPGIKLKKSSHGRSEIHSSYVVAPLGVLYYRTQDYSSKVISLNHQKITSFDITKDGQSIVYATKNHHIYLSERGLPAKRIARGRQPKFLLNGDGIVYSAARMIGKTIIDFDLKISSLSGKSWWLTRTPHKMESWPTTHISNNLVFYTYSQSSDILMARIVDVLQAKKRNDDNLSKIHATNR